MNITIAAMGTPDNSRLKRLDLFLNAVKDHTACVFDLLSFGEPSEEPAIDKLFRSADYVDNRAICQRQITSGQFETYSQGYAEYALNRFQIAYGGKINLIETDGRFDDLIVRYLSYFEDYLRFNRVDVLLYGIFASSFDFRIELMKLVCEKLGIIHCVISKAGHRISIREGLQISSRSMHLEYAKLKCTKLDSQERLRLDTAIDCYLEYKKSNLFLDSIFKRSVSTRSEVSFQVLVKETSKRFARKLFPRESLTKVVTDPTYDAIRLSSVKYVVFLPNKVDNFRLPFNAPFYSTMAMVVRNIAISLPLGVHLVVKGHPHSLSAGEDRALYRECRNFKHVHYIHPEIETIGVIEKAEAVITVASNSALDALFLLKHVIVFGSQQFFFSDYNAPIIRAINMEELPHLINQCLSIVPDEQLIKRYLYSFLLNSHSVSGPDDDWNRFQHHDIGKDEMYTLAGKVFTEYLHELEGSSTNDNK